MKLFGEKNIATFVESILKSKKAEFQHKIVIDIPAGAGSQSAIFAEMGARVEPYDLFPEFFVLKGIECKKADLNKNLPIKDDHADFIHCQEGIEHVADQLHMFMEFSRILKKGGVLLLTTPNYSNLRSKLSYILTESEHFYKIMPPNKIDSVWHADDNSVYFGHIFLIGIQKLRLLARLSGLTIKKIHHLRIGHTALLLLFFFYPFILTVNILAHRRALRKAKNLDKEKKEIYRQVLALGIDPRLLVDTHLFVEFEKV
ncbi:class I SAM-dependent methyltransferase [candidate division KSB1 bacterium]|nr:class I SAM-dependent methyltransferase [candidate division KSB1 bacterium]RQW06879.1 MAG: class I SAM-dependent methyltransferase [candidate division KSB1 bacterium]